ncbi:MULTISPECIES: FAD-dependent oxidoreductase [unclassified Devosia]|uniref:NAD(P)/FAD-dependent oxidoreductase n=1 Tax=unclassified Devosia TaxID=196773 RepID=UPI00155507F0|nr:MULTISPECIES: FAD-dependent oxidoreductase [unclassified Devosia]
MKKIGVVGAGIVGAAIATRLIGDGHAVTVFDAEPGGLPASSGNAALIALPEIAPIASPGMLTAVPKWLMDPLGPLTLRWQDVPALMPWLVAFLAASTPQRGALAREALTGLMQTALADHQQLAAGAGLAGHLRQTGFISLHDSQASLDGAVREAGQVRAALGYDFEAITPQKTRAMVPQLEGRFFGAVYQPGYWMVSNPLSVLRHFQDFIRGRGQLQQGRVLSLTKREAGIAVMLQGGEEQVFDRVVVAAGVWSRDLVRGLGLKVLLENERGYNTTFTDLNWNLALPVGFADHGFVAVPLVDGLRVGGAVELAKPETSPNFARAKAMREKMRRYVPSLPEGGKEWMGRRPSTPDSLPVIDIHPGDPRILYAFGHGHLGLTLSAVTANLIAGMVEGTSSAPQPFSITRFQ